MNNYLYLVTLIILGHMLGFILYMRQNFGGKYFPQIHEETFGEFPQEHTAFLSRRRKYS
jgi:hypothetical protein